MTEHTRKISTLILNIFDDDDPPDEADGEEMKDVKMPELDTDNVFLRFCQIASQRTVG